MKKGEYYIHVNCIDTAIEVLRIKEIPDKNGYKVKVNWVRVGGGKFAYPVGLIEEIFIPSTLMKDWKEWQRNTEISKNLRA